MAPDDEPDPSDHTPSSLADAGHTALDILGLIPVFGEAADVANAAWYAAEEKYLDAGLSLISVIPVVGDLVGKGGKLAKKLGGRFGGKAAEILRGLDFKKLIGRFADHPKLGPYVEKIIAALERWRSQLLDKFPLDRPPGGPIKCPHVIKSEAAEILEKAIKAEKTVSPDLQSIAKDIGSKLEGFDWRLKSAESLERKLAETAAKDIRDALRYTLVSSADNLGKEAAQALRALQQKGYEVLQVKNTFKKGSPYKGINTSIRSPNGDVFELQFHTPESFKIKQNVTHTLYEEARLLPPQSPRAAELRRQMQEKSDEIPDIPGLADDLAEFMK